MAGQTQTFLEPHQVCRFVLRAGTMLVAHRAVPLLGFQGPGNGARGKCGGGAAVEMKVAQSS